MLVVLSFRFSNIQWPKKVTKSKTGRVIFNSYSPLSSSWPKIFVSDQIKNQADGDSSPLVRLKQLVNNSDWDLGVMQHIIANGSK